MTADVLLSRLEGVRSTGHDKWVARCPAHESKSGSSLSIRELDGDRVLLYDFGGCSVAEILGAVGLEPSDLFPPRQPGIHSSRPRVSALTPLIRAFENDLLIVHVLLADVGNSKTINAVDCATAKACAARIWSALQEARHVH